MIIDLHYQSGAVFGPGTHEEKGIGGTENFITYAGETLADRGHHVTIYNGIPEWVSNKRNEGLLIWRPLAEFDPARHRHVLISFRMRDVFEQALPNTGLKAIMLADTESYGLGDQVRAGKIDLVGFVSRWQAEKIAAEEKIPEDNRLITSNGIKMDLFDAERGRYKRIPGKCVHMATPERGLDALLDIWPLIQERLGWAELHLFSSFLGWGMPAEENEAMCKEVYARIDAMIADGYKIINHKHAGAAEIRQHLLQAEAYLYPTRYFKETCCISALEAAAAGVPIVATEIGAMAERVIDAKTGHLIPIGQAFDPLFAAMTIATLANKTSWGLKSEASIRYARKFNYSLIVDRWLGEFVRRLADYPGVKE